MSDFIIEVDHLRKSYGKLQAVADVSFQVHKGAAFGLLGLNGAGKTTTLKMLAGLIHPDTGQARVAGYSVSAHPMEVRRRIGYVSENPGFYPRMTAQETLDFLCRLLDVPHGQRQERIDYSLDAVGLRDKKKTYVGSFSRGMRHRLSLAQALLSDPEILFLDEPTLGLDPAGAKGMRDLIRQLKRDRPITILMSSHVLPEVEALCSEVGIFHHGRLIAQDSVANLRNTASDSVNIEAVLASPDENVTAALQKLPDVNTVSWDGSRVLVNVKQEKESRPTVLAAIYKENQQILSFGIKENSLEEILLRLVEQQPEEK